MEPIFDRNGRAVGWLNDGIVHEPSGRARAFVDNGAVISYRAQHLGWLDRGYFRDRSGDAVAFVPGASAGPLPPVTAVPPVPPVLSPPPVSPAPSVGAAPPVPSLRWSSRDWEHYLG
ncbi:MAG: 4-fold beta flower protein [Gemmatimonadaceae bacterium]